ncbi:MAG: hypothetical protein ABWW69_04080 [Pyrodictiaceae archaeon]
MVAETIGKRRGNQHSVPISHALPSLMLRHVKTVPGDQGKPIAYITNITSFEAFPGTRGVL